MSITVTSMITPSFWGCVMPQITQTNFDFWIQETLNYHNSLWWLILTIPLAILAILFCMSSARYLLNRQVKDVCFCSIVGIILGALAYMSAPGTGDAEFLIMKQEGYANINPHQIIDLEQVSQSC